MKQLDFPTPYGVLVKLIPAPGTDGSKAEHYVFGMEAASFMAGIYDPVMRKRFCDRSREIGQMPNRDDIKDLGGHTVPHIALPRPRNPASSSFPKEIILDTPLNAWIDKLFEDVVWFKRSKFIETAIDGNLGNSKDWHLPPEIITISLIQLLTAALEHLPDQEIDCIEAAAWFALCCHREWQTAGIKWLTPFRDTWFKDWVATRHVYRRFANMCRQVDKDLPAWIEGGRT